MTSQQPNPRPTAQDAARRLVILKQVVVSALAVPPRHLLRQMQSQWSAEAWSKYEKDAEARRDQLLRGLHDGGWWPYLSPPEQAHFQHTIITMPEQDQANAFWRMEAVQTLMWALGLLPALPPYDAVANQELLKQVPSDEIKTFIEAARLREETEIDGERDTAEFWHWRSRTRFLIERGDAFNKTEKMRAAGIHSYDDIVRFSARKASADGTLPPCIDDDFPAKGKAYRDLSEQEWSEVRSITTERHYTLNWLCGYAPNNEWDKTPTDT